MDTFDLSSFLNGDMYLDSQNKQSELLFELF